MSQQVASERLWYNADRSALVLDGDPEATQLAVGPGENIPDGFKVPKGVVTTLDAIEEQRVADADAAAKAAAKAADDAEKAAAKAAEDAAKEYDAASKQSAQAANKAVKMDKAK